MAQLNDLLVLGNSNLLGDANIFGALGIYNNLDIGGNVSIGGTLSVGEAATFNKNVGITGNLTTNGTLSVVGTSTLTGKLTANGGIATTSITASGTVAITQNLAVAGDTSLGGEASDKIEIIGTTTISGPVSITGNVGIVGNTSHNGIVYFANGTTYYINNAATGNLNALTLNNTTDSTATTNGALVVSGGVGIAKQLRVAGNTTLSGTLTVTGATTLNNTTDSSSTSTGALIVKGGVGIAKQLRVGGNTTLTGNLTVNSGTVTIHKETSIANDYPAKLTFSVKQTDNNITTASAYIAVYDDHDANTYGTNMVITSPSALIIGGGESASAFYTNVVKGAASEVTYITSDGNIQFFTNCNTIGNRVGVNLDTNRQFYPLLSAAGSAGSLGTDSYYWANAYLGTTHFKSGHVYLEGSNASSSTGNTTQLVFGTSSTNHVVLSANNNALVINPTTSSTSNQIVLYLDTQSLFPSGINATAASTFGGAVSIGGEVSVGGALTFTGTTAATSQIHFNRTSNPSYFTCGEGGYYCFIPNGQGTGTAASDLTIADGAVYPGTTNVTTLGKSSYKWKNVYATTFTGALSNALSVNGKSYDGSSAITVGTMGIAYGGTGATTAIAARVNLLSIGSNPITSTANDTSANWGAYGPGATAFYSTAGYLNNQPQQYGLVMNISTGTSSELHQLWASQPHGDMYHRGGNGSGWGGAWKKIVDSSNFTNVLDGTYVNISGDTMTGDLTFSDNGEGIVLNDGTYSMKFMISGTNRGIYDTTNSKWLIYADSNNWIRTGGVLYTHSVYPYAAAQYCGSSSKPWRLIGAKQYYLYDETNTTSYGSMRIGTEGTTSTEGVVTLTLGNSTPTGAVGNAYGRILLYSPNAGYAYLRATANATTGTTHYLPTIGSTLLNRRYIVGYSGETYGSQAQREALTPVTGQIFFQLI